MGTSGPPRQIFTCEALPPPHRDRLAGGIKGAVVDVAIHRGGAEVEGRLGCASRKDGLLYGSSPYLCLRLMGAINQDRQNMAHICCFMAILGAGAPAVQ